LGNRRAVIRTSSQLSKPTNTTGKSSSSANTRLTIHSKDFSNCTANSKSNKPSK
jgi:hypothetical protein